MIRMRTSLLSLAFLVLGSQLSFAAEKELLPECYLVKDSVDPKLGNTEALFKFTASNVFSGTSEIRTATNGVWKTYTLDKTNSFEIKVTPGNFSFQFYLNDSYEEMYVGELIISAKHKAEYILNFMPVRKYPIMLEKPVIYCYAPADTPLEVTIEPKGEFLFTYPQTEGVWKGTVKASGGYEVNGIVYPYLFWEAKSEHLEDRIDWSNSELITSSGSVAYMERITTELGFNDKEKTDFITYWGPRLAALSSAQVKVIQNEISPVFGDLSVSDNSFHIERVYLVFRPTTLKQTESWPQQKIVPLKRAEKFILEWGGAELPEEMTNTF